MGPFSAAADVGLPFAVLSPINDGFQKELEEEYFQNHAPPFKVGSGERRSVYGSNGARV